MKCLVLMILASVAFLVPQVNAQTPKLKDVRIRGYVTEFRSPTDFDIEDYRARLRPTRRDIRHLLL